MVVHHVFEIGDHLAEGSADVIEKSRSRSALLQSDRRLEERIVHIDASDGDGDRWAEDLSLRRMSHIRPDQHGLTVDPIISVIRIWSALKLTPKGLTSTVWFAPPSLRLIFIVTAC